MIVFRILLLLGLFVSIEANSVRGRDLQVSRCSTNIARFSGLGASGSCFGDMNRGQTYTYPNDFGMVLNQVEIYVCPTSQKRIIVSNGIPDHDVMAINRNGPCELPWMVTLPLSPMLSSSDQPAEPSPLGIVAISLNGVPVFGAQESNGENAAEEDDATQGVPFSGHAGSAGVWHYHSGEFGRVGSVDEHTSDVHLGYAMDGFPIYGPVSDDGTLDECNGVMSAEGYRYHVRTLSQVDSTSPYCTGDSTVVNWKYVVGCFKGDLSQSAVADSTTETLPGDCVLESGMTTDDPTSSPVSDPTAAPTEDETDDTINCSGFIRCLVETVIRIILELIGLA